MRVSDAVYKKLQDEICESVRTIIKKHDEKSGFKMSVPLVWCWVDQGYRKGMGEYLDERAATDGSVKTLIENRRSRMDDPYDKGLVKNDTVQNNKSKDLSKRSSEKANG